MGFRVAGHRAGRRRRHAAHAVVSALCAFGLSCATALPAAADDGGGVQLNNGQCNFPSDPIKGTPWSLQRLLFDQMWEETTGEGVKVAVIDTGVDKRNRQLAPVLTSGKDLIDGGDGTDDTVGHGTKVAGIIAAQPDERTGFVGIAPGVEILPIRQNDNESSGIVGTMVEAIDYAVSQGVDIINISQGTTATLPPNSVLEQAVERAQARDVLIVASAGNDGADGKAKETYPAAFDGVLGVAASDRNDERAPFSQPGEFVDVAAPGVDMVSTVPVDGHCVDQGTSFAAPYATGVAALVRAKHEDWSYEQVIWHIEQTASRVRPGRDVNIGWGVVDPVAAMTNDEEPTGEPKPDRQFDGVVHADTIKPAPLVLGETPQERRVRYGTYIVFGGALAVALVVGSAIALRDWRRKNSLGLHGEATRG